MASRPGGPVRFETIRAGRNSYQPINFVLAITILARSLRTRLPTESAQPMTFERQALGIIGEELAARELASRGYAILERRYRTRYGEIDIVAEDGETLVFVEVRARATGEFGTAAESVTDRKKRKVTAMAVDYLTRHHVTNRPCRFDVVAIDAALSDAPEISVYPAAFDAV
jgi:putative endonuclease